MSEIVIERRRSGWDIIFGLLLIVAGVLILGDAVIATTVSVKFIGWVALISGAIELISAFFRIAEGKFWSTALGGGLLLVLGVVILRNTAATAVALTLVAGALFLVGGIVRIAAASDHPDARWILVISGLISVGLGLIVLLNIVAASFVVLGVLLGIQAIVEGVTLMLVGRMHARSV